MLRADGCAGGDRDLSEAGLRQLEVMYCRCCVLTVVPVVAGTCQKPACVSWRWCTVDVACWRLCWWWQGPVRSRPASVGGDSGQPDGGRLQSPVDDGRGCLTCFARPARPAGWERPGWGRHVWGRSGKGAGGQRTLLCRSLTRDVDPFAAIFVHKGLVQGFSTWGSRPPRGMATTFQGRE